METINLKEGIALVKKYGKLTGKEREMLIKQRFFALLFHAREHSELYKELYSGLGVNFFMREVPFLDRDYAFAHRDKWKCDETVEAQIGAAINTVRTFSFDRDYRAFLLRGSRTVIISATEDSPHVAAWAKNTTLLSVFAPREELVARLNNLKPALLWAYPSTLTKLLEEKKAGRLNIRPVLIMAGGEALTDDLRALLIDAFNCTVQSTYSSNELGVIASECQYGHLHVNDDWIMLEPLDEEGKPITSGIASSVLATNMYKTDYPVIRMTLPDRLNFHDKICPCGNISPWISVVSGKDDNIIFKGQNGDVTIDIDEFRPVFRDIKGIISYQLLIYAGNNISLRLKVNDEVMKPVIFLQAEQALRRFFREKDIFISAITLDASRPLKDEKNGKFRSVVDCR
ncbi:MAG: hypothetical protein K6G69_00990 [Lachnospiraceae bacterium]|nr:hypothetical protein [Lachnospiraceae bacterium]